MNIDTLTSAHKDVKRKSVGKTAFMVSLIRALASIRTNTIFTKDFVAMKMFEWNSIKYGIPTSYTLVCTLWKWLPFTYPVFYLMKIFKFEIFELVDKVSVRTKFIDDALENAVANKKISQILIVGAGLDARTVRLPILQSSKLKLFEIDFPVFLDAKIQLFTDLGFGYVYEHCKNIDPIPKQSFPSIFVGIDLSQNINSLKELLKQKTFNQNLPSFWILEGLTGYLNHEELQSLFETIAELSSCNSILVITWVGVNSTLKLSSHTSFIDDPTIYLPTNIWTANKHIAIGKAMKSYGLRNDNIKESDDSYWLSLHTKL